MRSAANMSDQLPTYKVILAGEQKVGKTRLFEALTEPLKDYGMDGVEAIDAPNIEVSCQKKEKAILKLKCDGEDVQVESEIEFYTASRIEICLLRSRHKRLCLASVAVPSICMYVWHNVYMLNYSLNSER